MIWVYNLSMLRCVIFFIFFLFVFIWFVPQLGQSGFFYVVTNFFSSDVVCFSVVIIWSFFFNRINSVLFFFNCVNSVFYVVLFLFFPHLYIILFFFIVSIFMKQNCFLSIFLNPSCIHGGGGTYYLHCTVTT